MHRPLQPGFDKSWFTSWTEELTSVMSNISAFITGAAWQRRHFRCSPYSPASPESENWAASAFSKIPGSWTDDDLIGRHSRCALCHRSSLCRFDGCISLLVMYAHTSVSNGRYPSYVECRKRSAFLVFPCFFQLSGSVPWIPSSQQQHASFPPNSKRVARSNQGMQQ